MWIPLRYVGSVTSDTFERLFRRLLGVFGRYHDTPRSPKQVAELGAARWDLELARNAIAAERDRITHRAPVPSVTPRKVALSDDAMARLRVAGIGSSGG